MVGICSYLLVSFWFTRIAANQSSLSALLTNRVGDCFLTIGMFALLWSFGKNTSMYKELINKLRNKRTNLGNLSQKRMNQSNYNYGIKWGSYLAGLIEGDGHIAVHDKKSNSKKFRPKIIIVFNINDTPLAQKISDLFKVGKVIKKTGGYVILQILAKDEMLKIVNLINGFMRTPKIEALHRAITWINEQDKSFIPLLGLDLSSLDSNNWLAGFTDADGNFSITLSEDKKNNYRVQTFFRIEVKQNYSREVTEYQGGNSYFNILTKITALFTINLYTRTRYKDDKVYYSFMAIAHNRTSHEIVRSYFDRYPLYSSKYLAYKDWCSIQDLVWNNHKGNYVKKNSLTKANLMQIKAIKAQFNSKRVNFDFSHLNSLTI